MPQPQHRDDNLMERFEQEGAQRFGARHALLAVAIAALVLVLCAGGSIRHAGEEMSPGIGRTLVLAVGKPAGWIADQLPLHSATHTLTGWLSPDEQLPQAGAFATASLGGPSGPVQPVTPDAFDPASLGISTHPQRTLHTLLVTGDSMSQPLDSDLAQALAPRGVQVTRDPHIGTGISKSILVDWGRLSNHQVATIHPDATVVFIGANDGFSMAGPGGRQIDCCGPEWAAIYATRVRQMMSTYRQGGRAEVYWLTLPAPREPARAQIARVVNAAITVAAEPWLSDVHVIDTVPIFTPGFAYRDSISVGGQPTIVRQSDGIHLNDAGSALAEQVVIAAIDRDFMR